ncbi:hypothetical protein EXU85_26015 [Spirosoma sp. KCTC 42546]|uniref:hypothetical protein n=1 Tax=Spirosoma sp. KCTC 42546 TaxID=2520506 RepID=UPI00115AB0E9|nr:hypothetical protein [Spirosoma sp. KCTC 42546]QDK81878.1 hypothetical protein EXU85_26015 [Spirosoma sp. KCTC 42546]
MNYFFTASYRLALAAILLVASQLAMSCESIKPNDVQPTNSAVGASSQKYKVENGRIVFKDVSSFTEIRNGLVNKTPTELLQWGEKTGLESIGATYLKGTDDNAIKMMDSFGFPIALAMIINLNGEYQIGNRIFWYSDGFRHEASSELELKSIKHDPAISKNKYSVGARIIEQRNVKDKSARTTYSRMESQDRDNKYMQILTLVGVPQRRRHIYSTKIFTESYVSGYPSTGKKFTALDFGIYLEYETKDFWGNWVWRQSADYRRIDYDFYLNANCGVNGTINPTVAGLYRSHTFPTQHIVAGLYTTQVYLTTLAAVDLYYENLGGSLSADDDAVLWNYSIDGSISQGNPGYTTDLGQPATYTVSSSVLW